MSIGVAVRKDARIVLATDSQTNLGSERVPAANLSGPKFMQIGDSHMAADRVDVSIRTSSRDVLGRRRATPRLDSEVNIFKFFTRLWEELHERYNFVKDQADDADSAVWKSRQYVSRGVRAGDLRCRLRPLRAALRALFRDRLRCAHCARRGACLVRIGRRRRSDRPQRRPRRDRSRRVLRPSDPRRDGARARRTSETTAYLNRRTRHPRRTLPAEPPPGFEHIEASPRGD